MKGFVSRFRRQPARASASDAPTRSKLGALLAGARAFRSFGQFIAVGGLLAVSCGLGGCTREAAPATAAAEAKPVVLRLGYTPSEEIVANREEAQTKLGGYLERTLGVRVELVRTASYGPAIEAMERGDIDVMSLGPLAYVLASERGAAEAIAATGRPGSGPRTYQSALITHRRTGLFRLEDVRRHAASLRFNYTDPASNSGHLIPQARLAALGVEAERDFASTQFTLSHAVAVFNVAFGKADVAGVSASVLERLLSKRRINGEELVVLWSSERLPLGPIAVRSALPANLKRDIQRALVDLPAREPETARVVMAQYSEKDLAFLPCDDSLYAGLRALAESVAQK